MSVRRTARAVAFALTVIVAVECATAPQSIDERIAALLLRSAPAPELDLIRDLEGRFDFELRFEGPALEPSAWNGTSDNHWVLGGRFLQCDGAGRKDELEIDSLRMIGFDARTGEFTSVSFDSLSPYAVPCRGGFDATSRTISMRGVAIDPTTQARDEFTEVLRVVDRDHYVREKWARGPAGQPVRVVSATFTRRG